MRPYPLLFLILLSLLGCAPLQRYSAIEEFKKPDAIITFNENLKLVYKAGFEVFDKHYSGLFVFRKAPTHQNGYISFLSEVGLEFFRFKITEEGLELVQSVEAMNKKVIINTLTSFLESLVYMPGVVNQGKFTYFKTEDNKLLLRERKGWRTYEVFTISKDKKIEKLTLFKGRNQQKSIQLKYLGGKKDNYPRRIIFTHQKVNLKIELNRI